ncbi:CapA family protein, partial [Staphylococcus gallinarum]
KLADQHGLQYQRNTNMSKSQLQQITTNVIDKRFLDNNSY